MAPSINKKQLKNHITDYQCNDVLLGRGNAISRHTGNQQFRAIVWKYRNEYNAIDRTQKRAVAEKVIKEVHSQHPKGRFLEYTGGHYEEVTLSRAIEKTCQSLREKKYRTPAQYAKDGAIDAKKPSKIGASKKISYKKANRKKLLLKKRASLRQAAKKSKHRKLPIIEKINSVAMAKEVASSSVVEEVESSCEKKQTTQHHKAQTQETQMQPRLRGKFLGLMIAQQKLAANKKFKEDACEDESIDLEMDANSDQVHNACEEKSMDWERSDDESEYEPPASVVRINKAEFIKAKRMIVRPKRAPKIEKQPEEQNYSLPCNKEEVPSTPVPIMELLDNEEASIFKDSDFDHGFTLLDQPLGALSGDDDSCTSGAPEYELEFHQERYQNLLLSQDEVCSLESAHYPSQSRHEICQSQKSSIKKREGASQSPATVMDEFFGSNAIHEFCPPQSPPPPTLNQSNSLYLDGEVKWTNPDDNVSANVVAAWTEFATGGPRN